MPQEFGINNLYFLPDNKTKVNQPINRIHSLDYLRGLAAFGIMIYHYLSWTLDRFTSDTFMGRLGIYGVSLFYVLSGLTLFYVYFDKMTPSKDEIKNFFKKRILRIFPLLWLVTILAILLAQNIPDYTNLFFNLSGLFGFIRWDKYFSAGVWSIGNELVFYVFFPFFIIFLKHIKPLMIFLFFILFGLYLYFAFVKLTPDLPLVEQWRNYVNPLNQVFLFLGGFLIGFFLHDVSINNLTVVVLFIVGVSFFIFYPASGDTINLVTGSNRLIFTLCCFLICISFFKITFQLPKFIHKPLALLGEASYSVYLLHPVVWTLTGLASGLFSKYMFPIPHYIRFFISVSLTIIVSYYVYIYFEKYFMKLGRTSRNK